MKRLSALAVCLLTSAARAADPGALVRLDTASTVSVLLDEVPQGTLREHAAADALEKSAEFWKARIKKQIDLMDYRLVFRSSFYPNQGRGPLPLPPRETWKINTASARRINAGGHDKVVVAYHFSAMIVTDVASPAIIEPNLAAAGGVWDEQFYLPEDPELLLERTGFACMDEFEFPPNSVFEEAVHYDYDQSCQVETALTASCHLTRLPTESCVDALAAHVGMTSPMLRFTRLPWNASLAAANRVGHVTNPTGANLLVREDYMIDERDVC